MYSQLIADKHDRELHAVAAKEDSTLQNKVHATCAVSLLCRLVITGCWMWQAALGSLDAYKKRAELEYQRSCP